VTSHRALLACLAAPLALAALASPREAQAAGLKHVATIAIDDKEVPLRAPEGVACTDQGRVVVADTGNGRLVTYAYRDGRLSGGTPVKLPEGSSPRRVQLDGRGEVLVLDGKSRRIMKVDLEGRFGGFVELKGATGPGAVVATAFKVDAADRLLVLDVAGRRVLLAGLDGQVTRELPLPPSPAVITDVALSGSGRLLAIDAAGSRLWAADKDAKAFKALGEGLKDRVSFPAYLAEVRGRITLVDQHGHALAYLGTDGSFQGRALEMGWSEGALYYPAQLCAAGEALLLVADRGNNRVQVFQEAR